MEFSSSGIENGQVYTDLGSLNKLRTAARNDRTDSDNNKAVTQQFESLFLGMMLKSMREANAAFEDENSLNASSSMKFYQGMLDQQLAVSMSESGGIGLAQSFEQQIEALQKPAMHKPLPDSAHLTHDQEKSPAQVPDVLKESTHVSTSNPGEVNDSKVSEPLANQSFNAADGWSDSVFTSPSDFVTTLWPFAIEASRKLGVSPKVIVAQAALETGWGRHMPQQLGKASHNVFGIKSSNAWQGEAATNVTSEYVDGKFVKVHADFRSYSDFRESFVDYVEFLQRNPRYESALNNATDDEAFIRGIHHAGYATDPNYADKVMALMKSPAFEYAHT